MSVASKLGLPNEILQAMLDQASREYPNECCGVVTCAAEPFGEALRIKPCRNAYDAMHEQDPETYPRTARTAFVIDPIEQMAIDRENRAEGRDYYLFYHSHIECGAYFSQEDQAAATFPFGDPAFPNARHLVIAVYDRRPTEFFACRWNAERSEFVGERLLPEEAA